MITVSIYCYLIKCRAKQLLPFHYTNNKLIINYAKIFLFSILDM